MPNEENTLNALIERVNERNKKNADRQSHQMLTDLLRSAHQDENLVVLKGVFVSPDQTIPDKLRDGIQADLDKLHEDMISRLARTDAGVSVDCVVNGQLTCIGHVFNPRFDKTVERSILLLGTFVPEPEWKDGDSRALIFSFHGFTRAGVEEVYIQAKELA